MQKIQIDGREIGAEHPPYVVAEISANHNGRIENALRLIECAKEAGADACKIQTYTADTLTLDAPQPDFRIQSGLWKGKSLHELYQDAHTPWEWHEELFAHARKVGITLFSSPFDASAVDLLEKLGTPAYKIASFEIVDLDLIRYAASTGKPLILSTGLANIQEIEEAVAIASEAGNRMPILLHCVSGYPAPASDYNLNVLPDLRNRFGCMTGLSDHTLDNVTAMVAVTLGATLIEKHFTLNRAGGGPDDSFSLEPEDMKALCRGARTAWEALGKVDYELKESEKPNKKFRRSLYVVQDVCKGDLVSKENVRSIRPGYGLPPKLLNEFLGKRFVRNVDMGTALSLDLLKDNL
jgi:N-acetylneuraminate synthase